MQHTLYFNINFEVFQGLQLKVIVAALLSIVRFSSNLVSASVCFEENSPINQWGKIKSRKNNQNQMLDQFQFLKIPIKILSIQGARESQFQ